MTYYDFLIFKSKYSAWEYNSTPGNRDTPYVNVTWVRTKEAPKGTIFILTLITSRYCDCNLKDFT